MILSGLDLLCPSLLLLAGASHPGAESAGEVIRLDRQANQFTASTQDGVVLGVDPDGRALAIWQSRRQQEGTYGIYARRFDSGGTPLGDEVRINDTVRGHQMQPTVALDAFGAAWIAWTSFGQDGDAGTIVARRFDAALETATPELVVNEEGRGDQREPVIAGDGAGRALLVWTSPSGGSPVRHVFARWLDPAGSATGASFRIDTEGELEARLPSVALADDGDFVIAWARSDEAGRPLGIWARRFDAKTRTLGEELRVSPAARPAGIEPVVDLAGEGEFVVSWLEGRGGDYGIAFRRFEGERGGEVVSVPFGANGYVSGLSLDARDDGSFALAWNRFEPGVRDGSELMVRRFGADDRPLEEARRATVAAEGHQRVGQADGTRKLHFDDDGRLVIAWSGNGDFGDRSGAHVSWLAPAGSTLAVAERPTALGRTFDERGAFPHEPPTFDPRSAATTLPRDGRSFATGDFGFTGIPSTGWTPPDPHLAAGPDHVVLMTNGAIAFYQKDGTLDFFDQIEDSGGFWGAQGAGGFVFDPEVVYDTHSDRFFAMACERTGSQGYFLLAVSDDSNPNGTWHKYRINVTSAAGGGDIDSPNIAVDSQAVYLTADFFSPDRLLVYIVDKAPILSGGAISSTSTTISNRQSQGIAMTYGTAPATYMVWADEYATSSSLRLYAITNPLTGPTVTSTTISVPVYQHPEDPPQLGTSVRPEIFEARFWSCVYRNGSLWATHHVGSSRVRQRWYEIDMASWPTSGSPSLVQSGEVDLGGTIRTFFGSIGVDADGNAALTFARSSPNEYISMGYALRGATDPIGTLRPAVIAKASTSPNTVSRWGDYSAVVDDPLVPNRFWAHHEYRTSAWNTWVHRFDICEAPSTYCTTSPNTNGSGALIGYGGSNSVAANDLLLTVQAAATSQFGMFYYGPNQISVPFGEGVRCVGGGVYRLGVVSTDLFGNATDLLDITAPPQPAGQITVGSTWNFQFWYRDPQGGPSGFNFSDGLEVPFCP